MARLGPAVNLRARALAEPLRRRLGRLGRGRRIAAVRLLPGLRVAERGEGRWLATGPEPWLRLAMGGPTPAGRWIRLRYRSGLLDDPVRPVLRILRGDRLHDDVVLPGPVCGAAIWVGRLPDDATGLMLSPTAGEGAFAFVLDEVAVLSRLAVTLGAFARRPGQTLGLVWQRLMGKKRRARHLLASIWATVPLSDYAHWREKREALAPLGGPDRPLPSLGLVVEGAQDPAALDGQGEGPWRLFGRVSEAAAECDYVGALAAGDTLAPLALAAAAAALARSPGADFLYSDEDAPLPEGGARVPRLQPGWSPRLHRAEPPGGLVLVRAALAAEAELSDGAPLAERLRDAALDLSSPSVVHLRRIALRRGRPAAATPRAPATLSGTPASGRMRLVTAIIPSKDRLELLSRCVEGLLAGTDYPALEVVVVDNGSQEPETAAYYRALASEPRLRVIESPGPFNYSALTNAGAAVAAGDLLLLLNNDMEIVRPNWLARLVAEAEDPGVAAIGPKLLYPDRKIQHAGVVIGLGGAAGHIYRGRPDAPPGWASRLSRTHEVSAVTGACILLERAKFEAVGGLDAEHLPVSFNDIDLCLKLRRAGWRNLMVPESVLIHHESASRGLDLSGAQQARAERESRIFAERWLRVMRDDPYYHPGLSLMRFDPQLG